MICAQPIFGFCGPLSLQSLRTVIIETFQQSVCQKHPIPGRQLHRFSFKNFLIHGTSITLDVRMTNRYCRCRNTVTITYRILLQPLIHPILRPHAFHVVDRTVVGDKLAGVEGEKLAVAHCKDNAVGGGNV